MTNTLDIKSGDNYADNEVKSTYSFCHTEIKYSLIKNKLDTGSDKTLIRILQLASDRSAYCKTFDNQDKRRLVRAIIHIILNERGIAPEFRDAKSGVTHKAKNFPEEAEESNDRQIIDLHWLFLHHRNQISPTDWNKPMFNRECFDFDEASRFVSNARYVNLKIKRLGIPIKIQKLLLALREQDVLTIQKKVRSKTADVREMLINKINEPKSRLPKDKLDAICAASRCLLLANDSPSDAVEYWEKMPLALTSYSPEKVLPWMKSRKVFLANLLKDIDLRKIKPKGHVISESIAPGAPTA
jgi:hypothetical protein